MAMVFDLWRIIRWFQSGPQAGQFQAGCRPRTLRHVADRVPSYRGDIINDIKLSRPSARIPNPSGMLQA